jgi:hypothetical protein
MIVRHSNAGISHVLSDRAGQVAQSGIARPPSSVQTQGDTGRSLLKRELNSPKKTAASVVIDAPRKLLASLKQILTRR